MQEALQVVTKPPSSSPPLANVQRLRSSPPTKAPTKPPTAPPAVPPKPQLPPPRQVGSVTSEPPHAIAPAAAEKAKPRPCNYAEAAGAKNIDDEVANLLCDVGIGNSFDELLDFVTTNSSEKWRKEHLPKGDGSNLSFVQIRRLAWKLLKSIQEEADNVRELSPSEGAIAGAALLGMLRGNKSSNADDQSSWWTDQQKTWKNQRSRGQEDKWRWNDQKSWNWERNEETEWVDDSKDLEGTAEQADCRLRAEAPEFVPVDEPCERCCTPEPGDKALVTSQNPTNGWQMVMLPVQFPGPMPILQADGVTQAMPGQPMPIISQAMTTMPQMQEGMQLVAMPLEQAQLMMQQQQMQVWPLCENMGRQAHNMEVQ